MGQCPQCKSEFFYIVNEGMGCVCGNDDCKYFGGCDEFGLHGTAMVEVGQLLHIDLIEVPMAKEADYYDVLYTKGEDESWVAERNARVLPLIVGNSVLDLGCGTGSIANPWPHSYTGIDFSKRAIAIARENCHNPLAIFYVADLRSYTPPHCYDTVLLLEVLEHVDDYVDVAATALLAARKRIIITVPRDMPGRAHVKAQWTREGLEELFGPLASCELFGGETHDRWWLAVKDVYNAQ